MTQNQLIEQIVEVLKRRVESQGEPVLTLPEFYRDAATEIASLHPITKLRGEVERLRDEAKEQLGKLYSTRTISKEEILDKYVNESNQQGIIRTYNHVLSLLSQDNDGSTV